MAKKQAPKKSDKQIEAESCRRYMAQLIALAEVYGGKGCLDSLPRHFLLATCMMRPRPLKIVIESQLKLPDNFLKHVRSKMMVDLADNTIAVHPDKPEMSLADWITAGTSLFLIRSYCDTKENELAYQTVKELLSPYINEDFVQRAENLMVLFMNQYASFYSSMDSQIVHFLFSPVGLSADGLEKNMNIVHVRGQKAESTHIILPEGPRMVFFVQWMLSGNQSHHFEMKPSALGITGPQSEIPVKVCFQSHALNRLKERVDNLEFCDVQISMLRSIINPVVVVKQPGSGLIEMTVCGAKLGYFACIYVDNVILIKTFLFLTNDSTPEGQLLNKLSGLRKLDKSFLHIDKLSQVMNSDLGQNQDTRALFEAAGCGHLLNITEGLLSFYRNEKVTPIADLMSSYIERGKREKQQLAYPRLLAAESLAEAYGGQMELERAEG